jgi:hypothetical protein|tara:strand:- start:915 stop:1175 length:261 start_codon:yes stop_codon:yes gene_type:complete
MEKYKVICNHGISYIGKTDGTKFFYNGKYYKYWCRRRFKKLEARRTCYLLNHIHNIKKSKKLMDESIIRFGPKKKTKKLTNNKNLI